VAETALAMHRPGARERFAKPAARSDADVTVDAGGGPGDVDLAAAELEDDTVIDVQPEARVDAAPGVSYGREDAPGGRVAGVGRTRVVVVTRDGREDAPGGRVTGVGGARVVVVAGDGREDAPGGRVTGVGGAGVVVVAGDRRVGADAGALVAHVGGARVVVVADRAEEDEAGLG